MGGWLAFIGAAFLRASNRQIQEGEDTCHPGHTASLAALGVFILWLGWFGFNPGSTLGLGDPDLVAHIFMTTNGAAAAGGIATLIYLDPLRKTHLQHDPQWCAGGTGRHHRRLTWSPPAGRSSSD